MQLTYALKREREDEEDRASRLVATTPSGLILARSSLSLTHLDRTTARMLCLASSTRVSRLTRVHPLVARMPPLWLADPRPPAVQSLARSSAPRASLVGSWVAQRGLATAQDPYDVVVIGGGASLPLVSPLPSPPRPTHPPRYIRTRLGLEAVRSV